MEPAKIRYTGKYSNDHMRMDHIHEYEIMKFQMKLSIILWSGQVYLVNL